MTGLLDPTSGVAADDVARAAGLSPVERVEALERRCAALERALTIGLRIFRGFDLAGGASFVTPEPGTGMIRLVSIDGTTTITDEPTGEAHVVNIEVTTPGCSAAWAEFTAQLGDTTVTPISCDTIAFAGRDTATRVRTQVYGDNTVGAKKMQDLIIGTPDTGLPIPDFHMTIRGDDGFDYWFGVQKKSGSPSP